jgi:hypothetical protein
MLIGTPQYQDRLAALAAISEIPSALLAELTLAEWADRNGFSGAPFGEPESDLPRVAGESQPGPCGHVVERAK